MNNLTSGEWTISCGNPVSEIIKRLKNQKILIADSIITVIDTGEKFDCLFSDEKQIFTIKSLSDETTIFFAKAEYSGQSPETTLIKFYEDDSLQVEIFFNQILLPRNR